MKKIYAILLFTFTFSLSTFLCKAQFNVYHPFSDSNAGWRETGYSTCETCNPIVVVYYEFDYYVRGDTVVNGKTYVKLNESGGYETDSFDNDTIWECANSLYCLLREDTSARKVYASFKPNLGKIDTLLYDFNLQVGDTLPASYLVNGSDNETVYAIDSILVGNTYRKQFIIEINTIAYPNTIFDSMIEGVGSWLGLMSAMVPNFEGGCNLDCFVDSASSLTSQSGGPCNIFHTCSASGISAIEKPAGSVSVYPNPSSGNFEFQITPDSYRDYESGKLNVEVYDILGEEIYSQCTTHNSLFTIDLSSNPNGIYLYRITDANSNLIGTGKLIINK